MNMFQQHPKAFYPKPEIKIETGRMARARNLINVFIIFVCQKVTRDIFPQGRYHKIIKFQ